MNERIKELYAKALDKAGDEAMRRWANASVVEKFAELIVGECADLCSDLDGGENMFSRGIRKHFGVE